MPYMAISHSVSQNIATVLNELETVLLDVETCTFVHVMWCQNSTIRFYMPMINTMPSQHITMTT